jgi:hypothetical protein
MNRQLIVHTVCAAVVFAASANIAIAQTPLIPTNVPGISVVPPPPAGFDPIAATPAQREQYAIPPVPDPTAAPAAYAEWRRAMSVPRNYEAPVLETTDLYNQPNIPVGASEPIADKTVAANSSNWSGTSVVKGDFTTLEAIEAEFVVPTARQAFGTCSGTVYSSLWPGIDGNGSNDVLQGGVEVDATCASGTTTPFYSAWIEWFPNSETRVSSPTIHPGDLMFVEVWATSTTTGFVYFLDFSTNTSAQYALTAPRGTTLKSNSVEWIVERPGVNGTLATLTNYIQTSWPLGVAWRYNDKAPDYYYEGANPTKGTIQVLTMLDNSSNPISAPIGENTNFLWFLDSGSACGVSSSPC